MPRYEFVHQFQAILDLVLVEKQNHKFYVRPYSYRIAFLTNPNYDDHDIHQQLNLVYLRQFFLQLKVLIQYYSDRMIYFVSQYLGIQKLIRSNFS